MSRRNDAPNPQPNPFEGFGQMFNSLESVNQAWRTMHMHSPFKPTLDIDELDKRIQELRTVEQWLALNLSLLRNTIQAMEVQRGTLQTLKQMSASFSSMASAATETRSPVSAPEVSAPAPLSGLWPGLPTSPGADSPDDTHGSGKDAAPSAGTLPPAGGLGGMAGFAGLPPFGTFPGLPGAQAFGGLPWIPGMGEAPDMSALFGAPRAAAIPPEEANTAPADLSAATGKAPEASPAPQPRQEAPAPHQAPPRHYTPPGWAAATGTDGWTSALAAAASHEDAAPVDDKPASAGSRQLAQAWWQLMQQQLGQMAAQAASLPAEQPAASAGQHLAAAAPAGTPASSTPAAPQDDKAPPSRNRRKKPESPRGGTA